MHITRAKLGRTIALGVVLASSVFAGVVHATPQVVTMTPTSASPVIAPGKSFSGTLQVINNGQSGYDYTVYSTPYHVTGENYTPNFNVIHNVPDVSKWFTLGAAKGHSNPGQATTIRYTITVPPQVAPGGYYATVFAQTRTVPSGSSGVAINERVGEVFYIQVAGPVVQKGDLVGWSATFLQAPPVVAAVRLQNTGGLHFAATVQYSVRDIFGHVKYSVKSTHEVLPQTTRRIAMSWDSAPAFGLFKLSGTASYLGDTKVLSTKWVLVVSMAIRVAVGIIVLILIILRLGQVVRRRSKPSRSRH